MSFTAGLALAVAAVLGNAQPTVTQQMPQAQSVQEYVQTYFADKPIMVAIADCESNFTQYGKDGQVIRNPNSSAVGVFQIMSSIHSSLADKNLGLDIDTVQGNVAYARYLYNESEKDYGDGTLPWAASKACWGKQVGKSKPLAVK